jgi:hypothetical protein
MSSEIQLATAAAIVVAVILIAAAWYAGKNSRHGMAGGHAKNSGHATPARGKSNYQVGPAAFADTSCADFAGAVADGAALTAADRAGPGDAEALFDMSPARMNAGEAATLASGGDAAAVTGRVYESGARLFGPGGLWTNPANRPRDRPLPASLGPLTGPLTASNAGLPAGFLPDSTPLPPDSACGFVDLPPATTGGASGIVRLDKTHANFPRYGSAPYREGFATRPAGPMAAASSLGPMAAPVAGPAAPGYAARRCGDAAGRPALARGPSELAAPERCGDYWSPHEFAPRLGTLAGGGAPVQLSVPDGDERSGWSEGGSGTVPMQWHPSPAAI